MKLKGANYDQSMIEFKLKEKNFPLEIASTFSRDFLILTNGIPLFVEMIKNWKLKVGGLENSNYDAVENNEESQSLMENPFNSSADDLIDSQINTEIDKIIEELKFDIDNYLIEKVKKFKTE